MIPVFLAVILLGCSFVASASTRTSASYTLVTESPTAGGAGFSSNYAQRSAMEIVTGYSTATIPDATSRFIYHGFIPQLDSPLFALADLAVSLAASPILSSPQEHVTFSGTVTNQGPDAYPGVILTVTLPANVVFNGANLGQGIATLSGNMIHCELGTIPSGGVVDYSIQVTPAANGVALVTASVAAEAVDLLPVNNSTSAQCTILTAVHFTRPGGGSWYVPANWTPSVVPGTNHIAVIDDDIVDFYDADATVAGLILTGGRIGGAHKLTVTTLAEWSAGELQSLMALVIAPGAILRITGGSNVNLRTGSGIENHGTVRLESTALLSAFGAWVTNHGVFEVVGDPSLYRFQESAFIFHNLPGAVFRKAAGVGTSTIPVSFLNEGLVEVLSGSVDFNGAFVNGGFSLVNSGVMRAAAGTEVRYTKANSFQHGTIFEGPGSHRVIAASMGPGDGSEFLGMIQGDFEIANGRMAGTFTNTGHLTWTGGNFQRAFDSMTVAPGGALTLSGGGDRILANSYGIRNFGVVRLASAGLAASGGGAFHNHGLLDIAGDFSVQNGVVLSNGSSGVLRKSAGTGSSTISANFFQEGGTLDLLKGTLALAGRYAPAPSSILRIHIGGTTPGAQFSRLTAAGEVVLNGTLVAVPIDGFVPSVTDTFQIVSGVSRNATYSAFSAASPGRGIAYVPEYHPTGVALKVTAGAPVLSSNSLRLLNGRLQFSFEGIAGRRYVVEASLDPDATAKWQPLQTYLATGVPLTFEDADTGLFPRRFYRVVLQL